MYSVSRLDTTILPSLTEVKQTFAGQPEILKNKKYFSKVAYPIKSSSYYNHPIELSSNQWIRQKLRYIHYNPVRNGLAAKPEEYRYSSASNYLTGEGIFTVTVMDDIWSDGRWG